MRFINIYFCLSGTESLHHHLNLMVQAIAFTLMVCSKGFRPSFEGYIADYEPMGLTGDRQGEIL
ncbi:hypothetical protein [Calothrix sp. 336/3]|uniref:hypothetical protein n=1 Tax=Calothrix sp. 336/3 TaxID=1337936 RepID=UPI0004E3F04E|nr:hypothetical protein [Calothrix sp. 336/3]